MMTFPVVGEPAPHFILFNQAGVSVALDEFRLKKNVVVYFYPKASTPGCTLQACGIRDSKDRLADIDTVILGISPDKPNSLKKFDAKYELDFTLLADQDHKVAESYGAWGLKQFMGREFLGIIRTSFIIDLQGNLRHIIEKVNTKTHNENIISYIKDNL